MKKHRYLEQAIENICFSADKMAFISGPRQCGKTTLAKRLLKQRGVGRYYNWDDIKFRRLWAKDPALISGGSDEEQVPLIILDEIHKAKLWKRSLKGVYDTLPYKNDILVTGSAHLNIYRRGSDSLLGRYYHFRLHPFSLAELGRKQYFTVPDNLISDLLDKTIKVTSTRRKYLEQLLQYGPFPEPLLAADPKTLNLWQRNRVERLIREDLRDMSRLPELSQIEMLTSLLPERVANPLSYQSLSEDLEVANTTVRRWIHYLEALYYCYQLKPYARSLPRAIKKEGKLYLWDWSEVPTPGERFENLIASHLLKYCDYVTDTGFGDFKLRYLRNRNKQEIDFLMVRDGKPWLPVEVKYNDTQPTRNWSLFMKHLSCSLAIQVTYKKNVRQLISYDDYQLLIISAEDFLQYLV